MQFANNLFVSPNKIFVFCFFENIYFIYSSLCFVLTNQSFAFAVSYAVSLPPFSFAISELSFVVLAQTSPVGDLFRGAFSLAHMFLVTAKSLCPRVDLQSINARLQQANFWSLQRDKQDNSKLHSLYLEKVVLMLCLMKCK